MGRRRFESLSQFDQDSGNVVTVLLQNIWHLEIKDTRFFIKTYAMPHSRRIALSAPQWSYFFVNAPITGGFSI